MAFGGFEGKNGLPLLRYSRLKKLGMEIFFLMNSSTGG
jgi:hypothetical protein